MPLGKPRSHEQATRRARGHAAEGSVGSAAAGGVRPLTAAVAMMVEMAQVELYSHLLRQSI